MRPPPKPFGIAGGIARSMPSCWPPAAGRAGYPPGSLRESFRAATCGIALLRWEQPEDGIAELNLSIAKLVGRFRFEITGKR